MKVREKKRLCRLKSVEKLPGFEPITIFMQSVNYQYTVTCRNCVCGIAVVKVIQPIRSTKLASQYWIITVIAVLVLKKQYYNMQIKLICLNKTISHSPTATSKCCTQLSESRV